MFNRINFIIFIFLCYRIYLAEFLLNVYDFAAISEKIIL